VPSVLVAGGGVAGLTCAWRLRRAGWDVEVLERETEPGGRMRSERHGGFTLDRGAQFITSGYRNLHAVAWTLGIGESVTSLPRANEAVLRGGELYPGGLGSPGSLLFSRLLSARAKARLVRLPIEVLRHWRQLDPLRPERTAALDGEDLASALRRRLGRENLESLLGPGLSAVFACEPEQLSWPSALLAARLMASGLRLQSFTGGTGLLTRTLARRVPVRAGCEVLAVETETQGARVRYRAGGREGSALADAVVLAVPGCEVARLCPKLAPAERGFFECVRYGRGIVVHLLLESPPQPLPYTHIVWTRDEGVDLYSLAVGHHKPGAAPPGAGLLHATLNSEAAARMWEAADAEIGDRVVEQLARTPIGRLAPAGCAVHRFAPMLPQFGVGYLARLAAFLGRAERSPRMAFAGDYLVGPFAEAALTSGMRAATEIARLL
jgi:oxygen-dependent protoporphyrinogen oxidase